MAEDALPGLGRAGRRPDLLGAEIAAARRVGLRFHPTRGSMDLGVSAGGLPPDDVVADIDAILAASDAAILSHHDATPSSMLRIAPAPCSPFSVTADLLTASAGIARARDLCDAGVARGAG